MDMFSIVECPGCCHLRCNGCPSQWIKWPVGRTNEISAETVIDSTMDAVDPPRSDQIGDITVQTATSVEQLQESSCRQVLDDPEPEATEIVMSAEATSYCHENPVTPL
jgi:hypothetical protein